MRVKQPQMGKQKQRQRERQRQKQCNTVTLLSYRQKDQAYPSNTINTGSQNHYNNHHRYPQLSESHNFYNPYESIKDGKDLQNNPKLANLMNLSYINIGLQADSKNRDFNQSLHSTNNINKIAHKQKYYYGEKQMQVQRQRYLNEAIIDQIQNPSPLKPIAQIPASVQQSKVTKTKRSKSNKKNLLNCQQILSIAKKRDTNSGMSLESSKSNTMNQLCKSKKKNKKDNCFNSHNMNINSNANISKIYSTIKLQCRDNSKNKSIINNSLLHNQQKYSSLNNSKGALIRNEQNERNFAVNYPLSASHSYIVFSQKDSTLNNTTNMLKMLSGKHSKKQSSRQTDSYKPSSSNFLQPYICDKLNQIKLQHSATIIQKHWRGYLTRKLLQDYISNEQTKLMGKLDYLREQRLEFQKFISMSPGCNQVWNAPPTGPIDLSHILDNGLEFQFQISNNKNKPQQNQSNDDSSRAIQIPLSKTHSELNKGSSNISQSSQSYINIQDISSNNTKRNNQVQQNSAIQNKSMGNKSPHISIDPISNQNSSQFIRSFKRTNIIPSTNQCRPISLQNILEKYRQLTQREHQQQQYIQQSPELAINYQNNQQSEQQEYAYRKKSPIRLTDSNDILQFEQMSMSPIQDAVQLTTTKPKDPKSRRQGDDISNIENIDCTNIANNKDSTLFKYKQPKLQNNFLNANKVVQGSRNQQSSILNTQYSSTYVNSNIVINNIDQTAEIFNIEIHKCNNIQSSKSSCASKQKTLSSTNTRQYDYQINQVNPTTNLQSLLSKWQTQIKQYFNKRIQNYKQYQKEKLKEVYTQQQFNQVLKYRGLFKDIEKQLGEILGKSHQDIIQLYSRIPTQINQSQAYTKMKNSQTHSVNNKLDQIKITNRILSDQLYNKLTSITYSKRNNQINKNAQIQAVAVDKELDQGAREQRQGYQQCQSVQILPQTIKNNTTISPVSQYFTIQLPTQQLSPHKQQQLLDQQQHYCSGPSDKEVGSGIISSGMENLRSYISALHQQYLSTLNSKGYQDQSTNLNLDQKKEEGGEFTETAYLCGVLKKNSEIGPDNMIQRCFIQILVEILTGQYKLEDILTSINKIINIDNEKNKYSLNQYQNQDQQLQWMKEQEKVIERLIRKWQIQLDKWQLGPIQQVSCNMQESADVSERNQSQSCYTHSQNQSQSQSHSKSRSNKKKQYYQYCKQ